LRRVPALRRGPAPYPRGSLCTTEPRLRTQTKSRKSLHGSRSAKSHVSDQKGQTDSYRIWWIPSKLIVYVGEVHHRDVEFFDTSIGLACCAENSHFRDNPECGLWDFSERLFINKETVKVHLKHTMEKLGANDRTRAVSMAVRRGIMHLEGHALTTTIVVPGSLTEFGRRKILNVGMVSARGSGIVVSRSGHVGRA
jgi:hypothetical protein